MEELVTADPHDRLLDVDQHRLLAYREPGLLRWRAESSGPSYPLTLLERGERPIRPPVERRLAAHEAAWERPWRKAANSIHASDPTLSAGPTGLLTVVRVSADSIDGLWTGASNVHLQVGEFRQVDAL